MGEGKACCRDCSGFPYEKWFDILLKIMANIEHDRNAQAVVRLNFKKKIRREKDTSQL